MMTQNELNRVTGKLLRRIQLEPAGPRREALRCAARRLNLAKRWAAQGDSAGAEAMLTLSLVAVKRARWSR
jgi:hypothetical protein